MAREWQSSADKKEIEFDNANRRRAREGQPRIPAREEILETSESYLSDEEVEEESVDF